MDDDKEEIDFNIKNGKIGILIDAYRKNKKINENELYELSIKYKL